MRKKVNKININVKYFFLLIKIKCLDYKFKMDYHNGKLISHPISA